LLVVGKKAFTLFLEIEKFIIFSCGCHSPDSLAVHQQPATAFPACPGYDLRNLILH